MYPALTCTDYLERDVCMCLVIMCPVNAIIMKRLSVLPEMSICCCCYTHAYGDFTQACEWPLCSPESVVLRVSARLFNGFVLKHFAVCSGVNIIKHHGFIDPWVLNIEAPHLVHLLWKKKSRYISVNKLSISHKAIVWLWKTCNILLKLYKLRMMV